MGKMYSLEEQLSVLTPEQLEALKQEMIKIRDAEIEKENKGKVRGLVGKGVLRGLAAFGEGAVLGLQNRPISEGSFMRERPASMAEMDDLEAFEEKERIKRRVGQEFEEPGIRLKDMDIPEGYEIVGYDQKGQPMIRKKTVNISEEKFKVAQEEKKKQQEFKSEMVIDSAINSLKTIEEVEKGISNFGLFGQVPSIPGTARANWEVNVNKLLSGKIIELMTSMKEASKTGATGFGQLSNKELAVLQEASTALKRGISPQDAQRYLNDMKVMLNKVIQKQQSIATESFLEGTEIDPLDLR